MDSQSEQTANSVSSVSLVISIASADATAKSASVELLTVAARTLKLPTTWVVDQPQQAKVLAGKLDQLELAVAMTARSPQRLRAELSNLQATVQGASGHQVRLVAGDPQQLRSRASLLADLGIEAIVSDVGSVESTKSPRQLPCGLWQLDPTISLPRTRTRWSFLPSRRPSLSQLISADGIGTIKVASIDVCQASMSDLRSFTKLMQETANASRQQQLNVASLSATARQLTNRHEVKPQRSILRRAA